MTPEGVFWLLLTGEVPTQAQSLALSKEWAERSDIPTHVTDMLNNFPSTLHPMAQFSAAVTALHSESVFLARYNEGMAKSEYGQLRHFLWDHFSRISQRYTIPHGACAVSTQCPMRIAC